MIISQLFYDVDMFNMFIRECKDAGFNFFSMIFLFETLFEYFS